MTSCVCISPAGRKPDARGQYVSRSAFVDLNRRNLFDVLRIADQPILPLGGLGEFDEFGTYPVSVIRDGNEVRAYYGGWTRCESVPFNVAIGMAISHDDGRRFLEARARPRTLVFAARAFRDQRAKDSQVQRHLVPLVHRRAKMEAGAGSPRAGLQDPYGHGPMTACAGQAPIAT